MNKLSVLIPTLPKRKEMFDKLCEDLLRQCENYYDVEILASPSPSGTIGAKRNSLLEDAEGKYVAFVDDDDDVSGSYIDLLMKAVESDCDCASLKGRYYVDGRFDGIFEHSIKYKEWKTNNIPPDNRVKFERFPNHLNMIRASIAKQFKFPEINHGEDHQWAEQIHKSGLIKTEFYIPEILYHYLKVTKNVQPAR